VAVKPESEVQQALLKLVGVSRNDLADKAANAIRGAATTLGMGGKTAVGYGYFE
jgi:CRISPR/Cas system CMR subunit Cmr6 (Cas7 group RAMP superfamily)